MKNMKIIVVVPHYAPAIGGVETYSRAIVHELVQLGHSVTVVTTRLAHTKKVETIDGATVIRLNPWIRLSNTPINPLWYFSLKKIITRTRPDVIHVHSPVPFLADMAVLAAGKRWPVHVTYHAGSMRKGKGIVDRGIQFYETHLLPRMLRKVDSVGAVLPTFVSQHTDHHVHFTPPGIDTTLYTPGPDMKRKVDVTFVGRIEKTSDWKGLDVLLQALALLKNDNPAFTAQIIGKGDALDDYKQLAKNLGIDTNITFLSNLKNDQLVPFYQQTKMIVLPSKTDAESFGMALAEGMACGAVAIGSRIGGIPNVIQHRKSGLLVPPNNPRKLCQAIQTILDDPKQAKTYSKNGLDRVRTQFTLKTMLRTNIDLLQQAARRPIVHISAFYPPDLGGMEYSAYMLTNLLHSQGHVVQVVTSQPAQPTQTTSDFDITRLPARVVASTPIMPRLLITLLQTSPRSIFHVHIAQVGIPEIAFIAAKLKRIPIIMHLHGDVQASSAAGILLPLYKKIFLGFVLRHADAVIIPTQTYKMTMQKRYRLRGDVRVIPTGIEPRFFFTKDKPTVSDRTTVLYVGRLAIEKNIPLLIQAVQAVKHPLHLIIAGDGPLEKSLQTLVNQHTGEQHIELVGRKTSDELLSYYRAADIFVLASNYESQSLATLEAMASGTPVVVANVAAVNEIVGDAGVLVEKTAASFTHAINQLIENPAHTRALSDKAVSRASQFSWPTLLRTFEDTYYDVR
jgi:glycosyltransferase involved in cell wall biosynthesis